MPTIEQMCLELGSKYRLTVEKWRYDYGDWRAGLDWYTATNYKFVAEGKTLQEALYLCYQYHIGTLKK